MRELHRDEAMIELNLACYAGVTSGFEEAKARLPRAVELRSNQSGVSLVGLALSCD